MGKQATPPANDGWRKSPARKDTKKWCKGKVGREHVLETVEAKWPYRPDHCGLNYDLFPWKINYVHLGKWYENTWQCYHQIQCKNCKKIMVDYYWMKPEDCPEYK